MTSLDITIAGGVITALSWGRSDAPKKILALHGWLDNAASFTLLGPAVAQSAGAQVIAIDFPGHGRSFHRAEGASYLTTDYVVDTLHVLNALGWTQPVTIIGHSLGGGIGLLLAAAFPERVSELVTIDSLGLMIKKIEETVDVIKTYVKSKDAPLPDPGVVGSIEEATQKRIERGNSLIGPNAISHGAARALMLRTVTGSRALSGGFEFRHDRRAAGPSPFYYSHPQMMEILKAVKAKVLYIKAASGIVSADPIRQKMLNDRVAALAGRITVKELPGGHHLHLDESTAPGVQATVAAFLAGELKPTPVSKTCCSGSTGASSCKVSCDSPICCGLLALALIGGAALLVKRFGKW